jgi:hypothetical protein
MDAHVRPESPPPSLLELQRHFAAALFEREHDATGPSAALLIDSSLLDIHRATAAATLSAALSLSFPAVRAIVGADFFEAAARGFMAVHAPARACLNDYGHEFPDFLGHFEPAATLRYLADVARLEWAVSRALHAEDAAGLDPRSLATLEPERMAYVSFEPHPAVCVLHLESPADAIWRAVLAEDDAAMAALETAGEVWLLVERTAAGVQVRRLDSALGQFAQRLCAGECLQLALQVAIEPVRLQAALAEHLLAGRLTAWQVREPAFPGDSGP